jgi:DNA-binding MarR family transcriptional regulator
MTAVDAPHHIAEIAEAMRDLQRLRASRKVHAALVEATGVDLSQQAVQVLVALEGTLPVARLAQVARMDVGAVSRQLRVLEHEGCVTKAPSPDNASAVLVTATERGRKAAAAITRARDDHLAHVLADWSPDDRAALAILLRRLVDDLQATPFPEVLGPANGGIR